MATTLKVKSFTFDSVWVCPEGVNSVTVECWGAGGGGSVGVGSGGGGAYSSSTITVTPGQSYNITVGKGAADTDGEDSTFDSTTVVAKGGQSGTSGGTGGQASSGTGDTKYSGGNGSIGTGDRYGAGCAGDSANGSNGDTIDVDNGGDKNGGRGGDPGYIGRMIGGGGGSSDTLEGAGAQGFVKLTYDEPIDPSYPQVKAQSWAKEASNSTSHPITLPSGITSGDLLVVVFSCDGNPTITVPGDWTSLGQETYTTTMTHIVVYKTAGGGDTLTLTTDVSERGSYIAYRIQGDGGVPTAVQSNGFTTTPIFGQVSPSAYNYLQLCFLTVDNPFTTWYPNWMASKGDDDVFLIPSSSSSPYIGYLDGYILQPPQNEFAPLTFGWDIHYPGVTGGLFFSPSGTSLATITFSDETVRTIRSAVIIPGGQKNTKTFTTDAIISKVAEVAQVTMDAVIDIPSDTGEKKVTIDGIVAIPQDISVYLDMSAGVVFNDSSSHHTASALYQETPKWIFCEIDTDQYNGTITWNWEIVGNNLGGTTYDMYLVDEDDNIKATISIPPQQFEPRRYTTTFTPTTGKKVYHVRLPQFESSYDCGLYMSRVRIDQVSATKTRLQILHVSPSSYDRASYTPVYPLSSTSGGFKLNDYFKQTITGAMKFTLSSEWLQDLSDSTPFQLLVAGELGNASSVEYAYAAIANITDGEFVYDSEVQLTNPPATSDPYVFKSSKWGLNSRFFELDKDYAVVVKDGYDDAGVYQGTAYLHTAQLYIDIDNIKRIEQYITLGGVSSQVGSSITFRQNPSPVVEVIQEMITQYKKSSNSAHWVFFEDNNLVRGYDPFTRPLVDYPGTVWVNSIGTATPEFDQSYEATIPYTREAGRLFTDYDTDNSRTPVRTSINTLEDGDFLAIERSTHNDAHTPLLSLIVQQATLVQEAYLTLDTIVVDRNTDTFSIDALVLTPITTNFLADGIIKVVETETLTVDGIILATQTEILTVDGFIAERVTDGEITVDGIITAVDYFILDDLILPRPKQFVRGFVTQKTDVLTLGGRTGRDIMHRKEKFMLSWEYLSKSEINDILNKVELNTPLNFRVIDKTLSISNTNVIPYVGSVSYDIPGNSYFGRLKLELIEES